MKNNNKIIFLFLILILFSKSAYSAEKSAVHYYNTGIDYYQKKNNALAIQNYKKAIAINPKFVQAYYNLAAIYYYTDQYTLAIENFNKVLSLNPKYPKVKEYLKNLYFNLGYKYQDQEQNYLAIQNYKKALAINPKEVNAYKNIAIIYDQEQNIPMLIDTYNKIAALDPNNPNVYFSLGYNYGILKQYEQSALNYKKALEIKPDFTEAKNNLEITAHIMKNKSSIDNINQSRPTQKAPQSIYNLVRLQNGVNNAVYPRIIEILDFLWSDKEGRILLGVIKDHNIPINITQGGSTTNAAINTKTYKQTIALYGIIPIYTFDVGKEKSITINVGENHINAFRDISLSATERIYAFHVLAHELGHATRNAISNQDGNSLHEEITVSMIGYNIASRLFNGRDLTREEAFDYSKNCLKALLMDDHRSLPLYNNFTNEIQKLGVYPPHPYVYQSLPELYKSIRNDKDTVHLEALGG